MVTALENALLTKEKSFLMPAKVLMPREGRRVRVLADGTSDAVLATLAVSEEYEPSAGDTVLLAGADDTGHYVIGVLERRGGSDVDRKPIAAAGGVSAHLVREEGVERLEVRDPAGRLLFQHDAETGRSSVYSPEGDLELAAPRGSIKLVAGNSVRLEGRGEVSASGAMGIVLRSEITGSSDSSEIRMNRAGLDMTSPNLRIGARRAAVDIARARYQGDDLAMGVGRASLAFSTLETTARRILEKAKEVFRHVEGLHSVRAGRLRSLVRGAIEMRSERAYMRGTKGVKIDGERIDLG